MGDLFSKIKDSVVNINHELLNGHRDYRTVFKGALCAALALTLIDPEGSKLLADLKPYSGITSFSMLCYMALWKRPPSLF